MEDQLISLLEEYETLAVLISITVSIIVAIFGVLPSFFVTIANVTVFGLFKGFIVSVVGEALGAVVSFYLYRKGFRAKSAPVVEKTSPKISALINSEGMEAGLLILSMRLFPYVPSGFVTYAAAIGKVSGLTFTIFSTIGKIPALVIEIIISGLIVTSLANYPWQAILLITSISILIYVLMKRKKQ